MHPASFTRVAAAELTLPPAVADAFPPTRAAALARLVAVDAAAYARTRNHLRGAVTRLSPYLTHGLLSVPEVLAAVGPDAGKLAQELAWREFFRLAHDREGAAILRDRFGPQPRLALDAGPRRLPGALVAGATGIEALDAAVRALVDTGYVHNHARMWLASVACHVAGADWRAGAAWFQFHLLDGDLASNALSWQWVAGSGSAKPYVADQANLNRFAGTAQRGTFLDRPRDDLLTGAVPDALRATVELELPSVVPDLPAPTFDPVRPLLAYHPWGLDPAWRADEDAERWLLLEPAFFARHPWSPARLAWLLAAARQVPGLRVGVGDAREVLAPRAADAAAGRAAPLVHRAHPAVAHWPGPRDPAPTAFAHRWTATAAPRSFSAFWSRVAPRDR
ncbi:MAG: FAD-binding domain-containing protein [Trueperaceae bacterium]|nr:FAD-binding domain-containing protein [Trueperaceae bacterium]